MAYNQPSTSYTFAHLLPYMWPETARRVAVNFAPGSYTAGLAVGERVGTRANEVQTITPSGTWSAGTYTISYNGYTTSALAYNANAATVAAALNALTSIDTVTVTGGPLSSAALVVTFTGLQAGLDVAMLTINTSSVTGSTPAASIAETTKGNQGSGVYAAYADANSDGTGVMRGLCEFSFTVDSNGFVLFSDGTPSNSKTQTIYVGGTFTTADTSGVDANGLADVNGKIVTGNLTSGVFSF